MLVCIQSSLFLLFFIISQALTQDYFKPSITCYTKYEHEETRSQSLNTLLQYSYHESEITHYGTAENEKCSTVGCTCFSYRAVCSDRPSGSHLFSQCTYTDQQNGITKWHYGVASNVKCDEMRRHPHTYLDLTCCNTDKCNNQPAKSTKISDTEIPSQMYSSYNHQGPQSVPMPYNPLQRQDSHVHHPVTSRVPDTYNPPQRQDSHVHHPVTSRVPDTYNPPQRHDNRVYHPVTSRAPDTYNPLQGHDNRVYHPVTSRLPDTHTHRSSHRYVSHVHHPTTTRFSDTYKPSQADDKSLSSSSLLLSSSFSNWMLFFTLLFCLLVKV